jgi:cytochrome c-type protein NapC
VFERIRERLSGPRGGLFLSGLLVVAVLVGVIGWGGFNWAMELTNTQAFCISCHEMRSNPYEELQGTIHDTNGAGVRAICSDCHVPKPWIHKVVRKVRATNELFHKIMGTLDTPEKFHAAKPELALSVWRSMKASGSRECRNCHSFDAMNAILMQRTASQRHAEAQEKGYSCIECHQGIAHELPDNWKELWANEFGPLK